jgi:hypothetical protein
MTRRIKLAAIALISAFAAYLWQGPHTGANDAQQRQYERPDIAGQGVPFNERLGADDGAAFAVHFSGDTHGSLEPCG